MAHKRQIIPRFIEFMDVGTTNQWNLESVVSGEQIRKILSESIGPLKPVSSDHPSDVAKRWKTDDGDHIGLIQSVTAPFCGDCSRARLSANGSMYTCLFATQGNDLRSLIRMGANKFDLQEAVSTIWSKRNDRYSEGRTQITQSSRKVEMSFIGG
jgi:cyclic pyranopterin phosphate synthase